jgi:predicted NAD/FAD-binding protein
MNRERLKIAIVGGGVAGIVSSYLLSQNHDVTLFEKNNYVGGHTATIVLEDGPDAGLAVDTGFIVCNDRTYPNFHKFLKSLGVPWRFSDMSFGFYCERSGLQYAGTDWRGIFAQRRNMLRPEFLRFLYEITRFNKLASRALEEGKLDGLTMEDFLRRHRFSRSLARDYVIPIGASIWSTPAGKMLQFPAVTMIQFFHHHGLLTLNDRPRWQTVVGGSHSYVKAFLKKFPGTIHTSSPVENVRRAPNGAVVRTHDGRDHKFDRVVMCAHANESLRLLADPSEDERRLLSAWSYENNHTVLHTDTSVMPPLRDAWASWNYTRERDGSERAHMSMTYHMNRLQGFRTRRQYCVTLNRRAAISRKHILREFNYTHPVYNFEAIRAQSELPRLNGARNTWFAGSYFGYGFHEDAVKSAVAVGAGFGVSL